MQGLLSADIGKTYQAIGLFTRSRRCSHKLIKIPGICFQHTSVSLHNNSESPVPTPIGRRPRPNPDKPPPTLVLPPPVRYVNHTTPRMGQEEAEEYLYPLYLRGWLVELIRGRDKGRRILTPFLTTKFVLKDNVSAREAVRKILQLEEKEKHDACYEIFLKQTPELHLRLQTHSARKYPLGQQNETSPHVTLRDVRFAVLSERMVQQNEFLLDQSLHQKTFPHLQLQWDTLLSWFPYADCDDAIPDAHRKKRY